MDPQQTQPPEQRWRTALAAIAATGGHDGTHAAAWWQQDTIGARTTGDTAGTAHRVLAGITDSDPEVLDTLPTPTNPRQRLPEVYRDATGDHPPWHTLTAHQRDQAMHTYLDAFHHAAEHAAADHCRHLLDPTDR